MRQNETTKVNDFNTNNKALIGVAGSIGNEEHQSFQQFFNYQGMKAAFIKQYCPQNGKPASYRKNLERALCNNFYNSIMLQNIREFVEEHKHEIELFLKDKQEEVGYGDHTGTIQ
jgi:hypothetical protein